MLIKIAAKQTRKNDSLGITTNPLLANKIKPMNTEVQIVR